MYFNYPELNHSAESPVSGLSIEALIDEAFGHPAVCHPLYAKFESLEDVETLDMFGRYLGNYQIYSRHFMPALSQLIQIAPDDCDVDVIAENLEDEKGDPTLTGYKSLPHRDMYQVFLEYFNDHTGVLVSGKESVPQVTEWAEYTKTISERSFADGVGALGLATELILPNIFAQILKGLDSLPGFPDEGKYFFKLHSRCDEKHGQDFVRLGQHLAENYENAMDLATGMRNMLGHRKKFCDAILGLSTRA